MTSRSENFPQRAFAIVLVLFGVFLVFSLQPFIVSFLGALIFYVLFRPVMVFFCEKRKWKRGLAATFVLLISFLVIVLPVFFISLLIVPKLTLFFSDTSMIMQTIRDADVKIKSLTGLQLLDEQNLRALQSKAGVFIAGFFSESVNALIALGMMYLILFYMFISYGKMESAIETYVPFSRKNISKFADELKAQTFSNALGAPLYAVIQGAIAAIGYWIFGVNEPLFWGVMTGLFSFVPVVGSTAIWLPAAVIMMSSGFVWKGAALGLYGLLVISLVDNVGRMSFQKRFANVHPLVTILGFILGVSLFGIPGIIFGPLLISYFLLLLKIYKEEFIDEAISNK